MAIFNSYVSLPEGTHVYNWNCTSTYPSLWSPSKFEKNRPTSLLCQCSTKLYIYGFAGKIIEPFLETEFSDEKPEAIHRYSLRIPLIFHRISHEVSTIFHQFCWLDILRVRNDQSLWIQMQPDKVPHPEKPQPPVKLRSYDWIHIQ